MDRTIPEIMTAEGFDLAASAVPVDGHAHGPIDRRNMLALRSIHLHESKSALEEDHGPVCVGLHPWFVQAGSLAADLETLEALAASGRLSAIGETGLDRLRGPDLAIQIAAMRRQIELSERLELPLVVHCVRAGSELLALRKHTRAKQPWLWHGWNLSMDFATRVLSTGSVPSFGASLFDARSRSRTVLAALPTGTFLLETDDSGCGIREIEAEAASIREVPPPTLREELRATWMRLFAKRHGDAPAG